MPARHPCQRGIYLDQAMCTAAGICFAELAVQIQAGFVMLMLTVKHRYQDGGIEELELLHSPIPAFCWSRFSRICRRVSSVTAAGKGAPPRNTHTPFSLVSWEVPRVGR